MISALCISFIFTNFCSVVMGGSYHISGIEINIFNLRASIFWADPPDPLSIKVLCMLIVLHLITCTHHPKLSIQTALQLVGLTTENLLPTALIMPVDKYCPI